MQIQVTPMNENKSLIQKSRANRNEQVKLHLLRLINSSITGNDFKSIDDDFINRIHDLVQKTDAAYVERLIYYCREELRPSKHALILLSALARKKENTARICKLLSGIIKSPEEKDEFISYYHRHVAKNKNGNNDLPVELDLCLKQLAYQPQQNISGQTGNRKIYSMVQKVSFTGQLSDRALSSVPGKNKKRLEESIKKNSLKYRELMHHLPEFIQSTSDTNAVLQAISTISDRNNISTSDVLPSDILDTYRTIESIDSIYSPAIMRSLGKALLYCIAGMNYPVKLDDAHFIMDYTKDMFQHKPGTHTSYIELAVLFKKVLQKNRNMVSSGIMQTFLNGTGEPGILNEIDNESKLAEICPSFCCIEHIWNLVVHRLIYNHVFVFTCHKNWEQLASLRNISLVWKRYRRIAPHARLFIINMNKSNRVTLNADHDDVYVISGYDHSVFELIECIQAKQHKQIII